MYYERTWNDFIFKNNKITNIKRKRNKKNKYLYIDISISYIFKYRCTRIINEIELGSIFNSYMRVHILFIMYIFYYFDNILIVIYFYIYFAYISY